MNIIPRSEVVGARPHAHNMGAQAMTFDSMAVAVKYLRALIAPTGVEQPSPSGSKLTSAFADAIARIDRSTVRGRTSSRFE